MIAEPVKLVDLTGEDLRWIALGCIKTQWRRMSAISFIHAANNGQCTIYRMHSPLEGILVTSIDNDMLVVELMSGKGFIRHFQEVRNWLLELTKMVNCRKLAGYVDRPGLMRLYERLTPAESAMTLYVEKLP